MGAPVEIYSLIDPLTLEVRYIGKAIDSQKRLRSHLNCKRNYPVYNWIKKLRSQSLIPLLEVIEITDEDNWTEAEIRLIQKYKNNGCHLLNVALGGDEPYCDKETRANNGRMVAKLIHSDEKRKRLWHLKLQMGISLKWLDENGKKEKADYYRSEFARRGIYFKTA